MNVEALHVALQQSFHPDAIIRDPAEKMVQHLKYVNGATVMLLQVAAEKQVAYEVRQAATIQLKNICRECWVERVSFTGAPIIPLSNGSSSSSTDGNVNPPKLVVLTEEDKMSVKNALLDALLNEHEKSVRDLLAETLHSISLHDYPERWPNLLPSLLNVIQQGNDVSQALRVHNALLALRKICKRYEYKSKDQRGPLNDIVSQSFPLLLPLAQRLSNPNEHSLEAALMLKQILKIFWSSTQFYLPSGGPMSSPESIQPWFEVIRLVLVKSLPENDTGLEPRGQPTSKEERNQWPFWKVKKWAIQIVSRLFSRYGMPAYAEDEAKLFAQHFATNIAPLFLQPVMETLNLRATGAFCTDRVVHLCLSYIDLAVELAPTYKILKQHLDFLLYKVCFPTLCLTSDDVELFENDPHEFVHRQNSPLADFYDPRMSAITLLEDLVKHRGKDVTEQFLTYLTECLNRYSIATDEAQRNHIEKDGALMAIGSLSEYLLKKKKYSSQIEGMLVTSVFPDFNSPVGFLRCRACWMVQRFASVTWSDDGTNLKTLIQFVLQRLSDPALPVQIEASKALRFLIEIDGAEETLLPVLPQILTEYFRIMTEIGNDEVVAALQVIIDRFGDQIEPHAVALVTQLATAFSTYCAAGDDDDDAAMAAAQCLECIATVLKGTCERPELYTLMYPQLIPLILHILGNNGEFIEYLEYGLDILTFITFFSDTINPLLWEAFPLIYAAYDQWAFDYLNMMIPPLENFIGKAPQDFLIHKTAEGVKFIDLIFNIVSKTVTEDRTTGGECRKALSLYMTILHCCKGMVDDYLPIMNDICLAKLNQQMSSDKPLTRITIFQVLGSGLYYNPQLQLQELEKRGLTQQVFTQWIKDSERMEKWLPRKMTVLGFSSILLLPTASMPPSIASSLPQLITEVVKMTHLMKEDGEGGYEEEEEQFDDEPFDDDEDDEADEGFGEDEDVVSDADEAYMSALSKLSGGAGGADAGLSKFLGGEIWDDDELDDEDNYSSPLDEVDQLFFVNDTLKAAFQREPEAYQQIQTALTPESVASCQKLFGLADEQRKAEASQAK